MGKTQTKSGGVQNEEKLMQISFKECCPVQNRV